MKPTEEYHKMQNCEYYQSNECDCLTECTAILKESTSCRACLIEGNDEQVKQMPEHTCSKGPKRELPQVKSPLKESTPSNCSFQNQCESESITYKEQFCGCYNEEQRLKSEQESQEDLINELLYETYGADLVGREAIAKKFHITRKP